MQASHSLSRKKRIPLKVWLPLLIIVLILSGIGVWYFVAAPFSEKQQQIRALDAKAKQLYTDHLACVDKMNQDYKELDSKNQAAYQKAYDDCEKIRQQQNQAVDEYKKLTQ